MEYYTWQQFEKDVEVIVRLIKDRDLKFKNIYGSPLGGLVLGVCLSHRLDIPLIWDQKEIGIETLVVDDIADTGKTLLFFAEAGNIVVTLFYHRQCSFIPDIWLREKKNDYIIFPWEDPEKEAKKAKALLK